MSRSPYPHTDAALIRKIAQSPGGKAGYKQLIRELGLGGGRERRLLTEQLTRICARGDLRQVEHGLWAVPEPAKTRTESLHSAQSTRNANDRDDQRLRATFSSGAKSHLLSGRLELHRDGFGFVRPDKASHGPKTTGGPQPDIFVPPVSLNGAMHGDLVLVDVDPASRDGRFSGRVARVLTRRNQTVVGTFHYGEFRNRHGKLSSRRASDGEGGTGSGNLVEPWDDRLGGSILIPEGAEIAGNRGPSVHRTLGSETDPAHGQKALKGSAAEDLWPLEGLVVEVEITRFAQSGRPAVGRVLEVLGPPDAFGVDVEIVIRKHAIPHTFPAHVLAEAEERARETVAGLSAEALEAREDFRGLPTVTIDGETAKDFDDGVLVRSLENGNTELQVHIADVSHYVQMGSPVDIEARLRGTSVYFPDRAVPMLPHALSSGMCSLLPEQDRMVLSCVMEIDADGEIVRYRVAEGLIRSARRLTYTIVQHCLNASPHAQRWNDQSPVTPEPSAENRAERERLGLEQPEIASALDDMLDLALRLNRKRVRRGSIDFDLPEPVVEFDPEGNMKAIVRSERGWAHRLIEEFMLSANECVATWLTTQGVPSLYRIHETPDPKRIVEFEETAATFGETLGIGALPVRRLTVKGDRREAQRRASQGRGRSAAPTREIPDHIPVTPQMYQRLVRRIQGKPEERILSYLMLRSLKQARYAEQNEGHFALASPCYTHFTSPIRRYPDLIVHRLVRAMLQKGADPAGGALRSTDPQPWKTEQGHTTGRQHGTHASLQAPPAMARVVSDAALQQAPPPRSKRAGRIGWSGSSSAVSAESSASRMSQEPAPGAIEPIAAAELADIAVESSQAERRAADAERELVEWKKMKFMADRIGDDFTGLILSVTKFGFFVELDELFIEGLVPIGSLSGDLYSFRDADRVLCGARTGHCFRVGDRVSVILDRIDRQQRRLQFGLLPGTEPKATRSGSTESDGTSRKRDRTSKKSRQREKKAKTGKRRKK